MKDMPTDKFTESAIEKFFSRLCHIYMRGKGESR